MSNQSLDPIVKAMLAKYLGDLPPEEKENAIWWAHGKPCVLHRYIEIIAAKAGVSIEEIIPIQDQYPSVAVKVVASMGERTIITLGEASPENNKNNYPWSMAEKRGIDRAVLKLVGVHGFAYSEEEMQDAKPTRQSRDEFAVSDHRVPIKDDPVEKALAEDETETAKSAKDLMHAEDMNYAERCRGYFRMIAGAENVPELERIAGDLRRESLDDVNRAELGRAWKARRDDLWEKAQPVTDEGNGSLGTLSDPSQGPGGDELKKALEGSLLPVDPGLVVGNFKGNTWGAAEAAAQTCGCRLEILWKGKTQGPAIRNLDKYKGQGTTLLLPLIELPESDESKYAVCRFSQDQKVPI